MKPCCEEVIARYLATGVDEETLSRPHIALYCPACKGRIERKDGTWIEGYVMGQSRLDLAGSPEPVPPSSEQVDLPGMSQQQGSSGGIVVPGGPGSSERT